MATIAHQLARRGEVEDLRAQVNGISISPPDQSSRTMQVKIQQAEEGKRRLIVGCDGTWVNSDMDTSIPSNVTRLCRALNTNHSTHLPTSATSTTPHKTQIIYYHRGIGTGGSLASKYIGGGTGSELSEHARECYGFICNNYQAGDEIFLFGFSRGAYTARAVSTLISDVGLLTARGMEYFFEVFEDWKNQNVPEKDQTAAPVKEGVFKGMSHRPRMPSQEYKDELKKRGYTRQDIPVKVVGVWDTVGALGIPPILGLQFSTEELIQYSFVNTKVSQVVEHALQALGLDDHRAAFAPTIWEQPDPPNNLKTLKQVWFPGVHCNIGGAGGYQDQGLANMTLAWMVQQLIELDVLDFDEEYLGWVFDRNVEHTREIAGPQGFRGWAMGKMEETLTTAYSLVGEHKNLKDSKTWTDWLHPGDLPRTPGRYEETERINGQRQTTGKLLHGTNEKIHPSVRVRVAKGGLGLTDKEKYFPKGLEDWTYVGKGDEKDPLAPGFVWKSKKTGQVLEESDLGDFEKAFLYESIQAKRLESL